MVQVREDKTRTAQRVLMEEKILGVKVRMVFAALKVRDNSWECSPACKTGRSRERHRKILIREIFSRVKMTARAPVPAPREDRLNLRREDPAAGAAGLTEGGREIFEREGYFFFGLTV